MLAPTPLLTPRLLIRTATAPKDKESAIREAAQLLIAAGCIDPAYGDSMLRREEVANTYLGHGVVIPTAWSTTGTSSARAASRCCRSPRASSGTTARWRISSSPSRPSPTPTSRSCAASHA